MKETSLERLNADDDWPPIFSLHLKSDVTASRVRTILRTTPSNAKVYVIVEKGGLRPDELEDIVAPHVESVSVRVAED